ncbi:MAG: Hsp70 protein that interacts with Zuo1p [Caeruleum heppii]|nr:MAG: Hsp70 protein that interacts with Zuo1p [Caeruleum heppii]
MAESVDAGRTAIGISFGNSNSSIAFTSGEGKPEVIANEEGDRQIPSILSYVAGEEYHGAQAKSHLVRNPNNTVAYFRDFLGKDFKSIDPTPCHASAHPLVHASTVAFSLQQAETDERSTVTVSEITTRHLRRLASSASDYLGRRVTAAVITIPTDFSDQQKEEVAKAAKKAEIEVLQFISEPVAAVLAYGARTDAKIADKMVVVADLGGTRSDVAVVASRGGIYSVLATAHDYEFGGAQLDQVLVDFFAKEFVKKHKTDPRENARSLAKLKLEAESTKKALSLGSSASLSIESLAEGIDFSSTVNRTRYELLASRVFGNFTRLIETVVQKAELDILDIDEAILSGGTSHTPKIAQLLQSLFPASTTIQSPSTLSSALNPSELAVRGAAIQASLIQEFDAEDIEQSTHPMVTVTPHLSRALGVLVGSLDDSDAVFQPLLPAETAVPARRTAQYPSPKAGGDVLVRLCEGERQIHVTKPEPKRQPTTNGRASTADDDDDDDDDDSDPDSDEEADEIRRAVWKPGKILAEAAVRGVTKAKKIEVMVNVTGDLAVTVTAREVGGKGGVRGAITQPAVMANGKAS